MRNINRFVPDVNKISMFREIAKNLVNPLEIVREALSNSHDADSKEIEITIYRNNSGDLVIQISDDGMGMDLDTIHRFFNLGDSSKFQVSIGEKGLGTKTYFKSKKVTVITQTNNGKRIKAVMDKPWDNLTSDQMPEYLLEELTYVTGKNGTIVKVEGYFADYPEKYFNFETLKDYILWFTAAGSFKTIFAANVALNKYIRNIQIAPRIFLDDKINNQSEELSGTHRFSNPDENPEEDTSEKIYKKSVNYCRHFGPFFKETTINGEYVSFQLYGTISCLNKRKQIVKLRQGETYKSRFGLYLCKDFIPIIRYNDLLNEPNYQHYHILLNSQVFELTADRNNISNIYNPKVRWVLEEAEKIINKEIKPIAARDYFSLRKKEELEAEIINKKQEVKRKLLDYDQYESFKSENLPIEKLPKEESQVAIIFAMILADEKKRNLINGIKSIGYYSYKTPTDMICLDQSDNKVLVELEYRLSNLFKHEHPYGTFDYIVCWDVDLDINEKKKTPDGITLKLIKDQEQWILKYGPQRIIPIIELKNLMKY